ncbi:NEAT domain-containing protein [Paenibacillus sinopodophylli]|uniref:NEAT domain-containing protein n=1 Tax=Paenibacillus sinopodophylli TaxID=1837342 RepID=UPI0014873412|nr:NEAT domain-containing protein [Paenibacillus sinopodophylli]
MKNNLRKSVAMLLAFMLLLTSFQLSYAADSQEAIVQDGEYAISYSYWKDNEATASAANGFMQTGNAGKLIIQNGKAVFEHEITNKSYAYFHYLGSRKSGNSKAVITSVGSNYIVDGQDGYQPVTYRPANNGTGNWIVGIDIENVWQKQDILMHVEVTDIPGFTYNHWYNVQLNLNTSTLPQLPVDGGGDNGGNNGGGTEQPVTLEQVEELITVSRSVYDHSTEGTSNGDYPVGSKALFYDSIVLAESDKAAAGSDAALLKEVYMKLETALNLYKSLLLSADKSGLSLLIHLSEEISASAVEVGTAEGKPGDIYAPITPGEYAKGSISNFKADISNAKTVLNNERASQTAVDAAVNTINARYIDFSTWQYIAAEPTKIYVLDSLDPTTVESTYFEEIERTTALITNTGLQNRTSVNLTFNASAISEVIQSNALEGGGMSTDPLVFTRNRDKAIPINNSTTAEKKVYQVIIRNLLATDEVWQGLSFVKYKLEGETKQFYVSYNAEWLQELEQAAASVQKQLDAAIAVTGEELQFENAKAELQTAIHSAEQVSRNLAATRPQITSEKSELQAALAAFKETAATEVYFSAVYADKEQFSTMDSYFAKPALVTTQNGSTFVTLTVKDSSTVQAFRVKTGGAFVESEVISQDTEANTRVVTFKVDDLSALVSAQVRVVIPARNYDSTHDIRLNINNVNNAALALAIADATALDKAAVAGSNKGEYPASAKSTLQSAILTASAEAVRVTGTQELTDTAWADLQAAIVVFKAAVITVTTPDPTATPIPDSGLANGQYSINVKILKFGTEQDSVMQSYINPNAKLIVSGSSNVIHLTIKQDKEITGLKFNGANVSVVSRNVEQNTRVVSFSVSDLSKVVNGWVKIDWPEMDYFHEYDIQIKFDQTSIRKYDGSDILPVEDEETAVDDLVEPVVTNFKDIQGHWAQSSIEKAIALGIAKGYEDGKFYPNAVINRAEFAVMISRALKLEASKEGTKFNDKDQLPKWAEEHIARAAKAGLIGGYDDQTFRAKNEITRAELAVIIARAAKLETKEDAVLSFADAAEFPTWARQEAAAAIEAGYIQGKGNNRFDPNASATRAEALTLILRLLEKK